MFLFVVRNLRGLARWPMFPQIFDGVLLAWTWIFHPVRVQVMDSLEAEMRARAGVSVRPHRLGGMEFFHAERGELGHVHGHGLLDVHLEKRRAEELRRAGRVLVHHVLPDSGWVSFSLRSPEDLPFALQLLRESEQRSVSLSALSG